MKQVWHDLLFMHWPVAVEPLRQLIPPPLQLDLYERQAWVSVVPFTMSGIRLHFTPPVPFASTFAELNVRTYVTVNGKPGVFFFSLDAANLLAVKAARWAYHLPYFHARFNVERQNDTIHYQCNRLNSSRDVQFQGSYRPVSEPFNAQPGTRDYWLAERYCLYAYHQGKAYRCEIEHPPWELQHAEADVPLNTMAQIDGIEFLVERPLLHFSRIKEVLTWGLDDVAADPPAGASHLVR
jgi:uncharacterized protein YqjF (DUF2071 family)